MRKIKETPLNLSEEKETFKHIEKEYKNLRITYDIASTPCYEYGIITDELDIITVHEIKGLKFTDKKTGGSININKLIPDGFKIGIAKNGQAKLIREEKLIIIRQLGGRLDQFSLFHEIGHTRQQREFERRTEEIDVDGKKIKIFLRISPEEFREELPYEKDANEFAVKKIIQLRNQGIDLEPEMTNEDLQKHIQKNIKNIEEWLE